MSGYGIKLLSPRATFILAATAAGAVASIAGFSVTSISSWYKTHTATSAFAACVKEKTGTAPHSVEFGANGYKVKMAAGDNLASSSFVYIEEVNKADEILPNTTLGKIHNCYSSQRTDLLTRFGMKSLTSQ